jgi:hypothetical protein
VSDAQADGSRSGNAYLTFTVTLAKASSVPVEVEVWTQDETAIVGRDYIALDGTLTFAPGKTRQIVRVVVLGSAARKGALTLRLNAETKWGSGSGIGTINSVR